MSDRAPYENLLRRRDFSEELEVFDAAQYFHSADDFYDEQPVYTPSFAHPYGAAKSPAKGSFSLEYGVKQKIENKKHRPAAPSSPAGKLTNFLNSLFVQTRTKKKTRKPCENFPDQLSGSQRMRRSSSSVMNFENTTRKNTCSASEIQFPATKTHQECRYLVEKYRSSKVSCLNQFPGEKQWTDNPWVDRSSVFRPRTPDAKCHGKSFKLRDSKTRSNDYDEAASDSSEDLFDLPKHHLMAAAAGLPLYKANMI